MIRDIDIEAPFAINHKLEVKFLKELNQKIHKTTKCLSIVVKNERGSSFSYHLECEAYKFPYNKPERKSITLHPIAIFDFDDFLADLIDLVRKGKGERGNRYFLLERFVGDLAIFEDNYRRKYFSHVYPGNTYTIDYDARHKRIEVFKRALTEASENTVKKEMLKRKIYKRLQAINMPWLSAVTHRQKSPDVNFNFVGQFRNMLFVRNATDAAA